MVVVSLRHCTQRQAVADSHMQLQTVAGGRQHLHAEAGGCRKYKAMHTAAGSSQQSQALAASGRQ